MLRFKDIFETAEVLTHSLQMCRARDLRIKNLKGKSLGWGSDFHPWETAQRWTCYSVSPGPDPLMCKDSSVACLQRVLWDYIWIDLQFNFMALLQKLWSYVCGSVWISVGLVVGDLAKFLGVSPLIGTLMWEESIRSEYHGHFLSLHWL